VLTPEAIQEGIETHQQATVRELETLDQRIGALEKRQRELDRDAEKMIAAYKANVISLDELAKDKGFIDVERRSIEEEFSRLEELRRDAVWFDAEALKTEAHELRAYMPHMNDEERSALLERVHLTVLRTLNDAGEQVIKVTCRLGTATLLLSSASSSQPPNSTPPISSVGSSSHFSRENNKKSISLNSHCNTPACGVINRERRQHGWSERAHRGVFAANAGDHISLWICQMAAQAVTRQSPPVRGWRGIMTFGKSRRYGSVKRKRKLR
jgi:hypothetical protein